MVSLCAGLLILYVACWLDYSRLVRYYPEIYYMAHLRVFRWSFVAASLWVIAGLGSFIATTKLGFSLPESYPYLVVSVGAALLVFCFLPLIQTSRPDNE